MYMPSIFLIVMALLLLVSSSAALAAAAAADARLGKPRDLDAPHDFRPNFADRAAWERRAAALRTQALVAQGLWPMPRKTLLNAVVHGRTARDAYTIEKVFFASLPGHYVSGNLYRPKAADAGRKFPAVLAPHGHWPDGRMIWRTDEQAQKEIDSGAEVNLDAARSPLQANAATLARMGCIVFHFDAVGSGDSQRIAHREGFNDAEATLRLQSFMGLQTWNAVRALDFLLELPDVDPSRVASVGSSGGATQAIALNIADPRVAVTFPMVMVSMAMQGGCVCENAPLYRVNTNNVELASLFAPRPAGMAAANDWTKDFLTRGLPEMKAIWTLYDAADRVEGAHVDFGHNHNLHGRRLQYAFLNKHLNLGHPTPIDEQPYEPVPPKELSVYDAQHPLPPDAADAATLREWMTRASDEQLATLDDTEYVRTVRAALAAMVVSELPPPADVVAADGFLSRRGAGERVAYKLIRPANFSGDVVVWAHPDGCESISQDLPHVKRLIEGGRAVLAIDPFPARPPAGVTPTPNRPGYAGYTHGYNRSTIAERVHDLLTAITFAQTIDGRRAVHLAGVGDAGPAALLARALAGSAVSRASIDVNGFDFDRVTADDDPMMLPGALKYGGVRGFTPLCTEGRTILFDVRASGINERPRRTPNVTFEPGKGEAWEIVNRLLD